MLNEAAFEASHVSIPYSTIKITQGHSTRGTKERFQFLIVRLKYGTLTNAIIEKEVSIPYSTIKMRQPERQKYRYWVSIPYSTIKISKKEICFYIESSFNSL